LILAELYCWFEIAADTGCVHMEDLCVGWGGAEEVCVRSFLSPEYERVVPVGSISLGSNQQIVKTPQLLGAIPELHQRSREERFNSY
jgi:hypothetical protein